MHDPRIVVTVSGGVVALAAGAAGAATQEPLFAVAAGVALVPAVLVLKVLSNQMNLRLNQRTGDSSCLS